jgi:hypothetical protein
MDRVSAVECAIGSEVIGEVLEGIDVLGDFVDVVRQVRTRP